MAKEKEEIYNNISIEDAMLELRKKRDEILSDFSKAYLAETSLLPSEVELCCQETVKDANMIETVYFFRKKQNVKTEMA